MPAEVRKAIHAYLTPKSHDAIQEFTDGEGLSMSGFLEALGEQLDLVNREQVGGPITFEALVQRARKIDAQRRRRGGS